MKKGLSKFMFIPDPNDNLRTIIFRTQYPKFVFELTKELEPEGKTFQINGITHNISVRKDYDNYGEPPESYLKEVLRWWYYQVEDFDSISAHEADKASKSNKELDLKGVFEFLNGAHVAQDCFNKDRTWLYQRLNGNIVNGKPAELNGEQKEQLADYLRLKAQELLETAKLLEQ